MTRTSRDARPRVPAIHPAWWVAAVHLPVALVGAAGFRSMPGVLIDPLHDEFGWSLGTISLARLDQPGAVRADRAVRGRADGALRHPPGGHRGAAAGRRRQRADRVHDGAAGSWCCLGPARRRWAPARWRWPWWRRSTGRWFVARRGLVSGILTAGQRHRATGLPAAGRRWPTGWGWRAAALGSAAAALAVVPLVCLAAARPPARTSGRAATAARPDDVPPRSTTGAARRPSARCSARPAPAVLAAGRRLRHLRRVDERAGPAALRPRRARPRDAGDHRGRACWPWSGSSTSPARSPPAGSPTGSTRGCCCWPTTGCAGCRWSCCRPLFGADLHASMLAFIVFYGLDWVATVPPTMALCREHLRRRRARSCSAGSSPRTRSARRIAALAAGLVRDHFGSYTPAWFGGAVLCVVGSVLSVLIKRGPVALVVAPLPAPGRGVKPTS